MVVSTPSLIAVPVLGCALAVGGCASTGEVVTLDIKAISSTAGAGKQQKVDTVRVSVGVFEDARTDKSMLGQRLHLLGGKTRYNLLDGKVGLTVSKVVADHLRAQGWSADLSQAGAGDVVLTGKVVEFSANSVSKVFSTEMTVKTRLALEAKNIADNSTLRMTVSSDGSQSVFWYADEDLQDLASAVITEGIDKFVQNSKFEGKVLRWK